MSPPKVALIGFSVLVVLICFAIKYEVLEREATILLWLILDVLAVVLDMCAFMVFVAEHCLDWLVVCRIPVELLDVFVAAKLELPYVHNLLH